MSGPDRGPLMLATSNPGKLAEFRHLLPTHVAVLSLADLDVVMPPEDGPTFAANAQTKARSAAAQCGLIALADDSGLEVDALAGAPGIRSARFAGEPSDEAANRAALLAALEGVPAARRTARFRCSVALASPQAIIASAEGVCDGAIALSPRGSHGFGYDPIFLLPDGRTMAELPSAAKNAISHRAKAYRAILPALLAMLRGADSRSK